VTFKVAQGHLDYRYSIGHVSLLISGMQ